MANWNARQLLASDINNGQEFSLLQANKFATQEINKFINGVLFADGKAISTIVVNQDSTLTFNFQDGTSFTTTNSLKGEKGEIGDNIELRVSGGYIQWKPTSSSTWENLVAIGELVQVDQTLSTTSTNAIANSVVATNFETVNQNKANKSTIVNATLTVAGWGASTVAQTVSVSGVTASNNIVVSLSENATADEVSASAEAMVRATAQGEGTITFTCLSGTAPAIPLTVSVVILG